MIAPVSQFASNRFSKDTEYLLRSYPEVTSYFPLEKNGPKCEVIFGQLLRACLKNRPSGAKWLL